MGAHATHLVQQLRHIGICGQEALHHQVQHMRKTGDVRQPPSAQGRHQIATVVAHHLAGLQVERQQPLICLLLDAGPQLLGGVWFLAQADEFEHGLLTFSPGCAETGGAVYR